MPDGLLELMIAKLLVFSDIRFLSFYTSGSKSCDKEFLAEYEYNTGVVIVDKFKKDNINWVHTPAVLVKNHGPFSWGKNPDEAVYHAVVAEQVAKMAFVSFTVMRTGVLAFE